MVSKTVVGVSREVKGGKISFIFVPGHACMRGNEKADDLAEKATIREGSWTKQFI